MRRCIARAPRITFYLSLFAGCTDPDPEEGPTQTSAASEASASSSTDTPSSTATTGTTATPTGTGESGTEDTGDSDDTGATGVTGGTTITGDPGDTDTTGETGAADGLGFAVDVWPILDVNCSCHKDSGGAGMLRMRDDDAYANLVGKASTQAPILLVEPGSAMESYLWHKLNDTQLDVGGYGKRMPSGGLLEPEERELVQQWIDEGAKP